MKKVIALVVCVAMLACFAVTASAEAVKATFTVATVEGVKGDIVNVDITIAEQGTGIGALEIKINYDSENLKFVKNPDEGKYFVVGEATNGASAVGNEDNMLVAFASVDGFFKVGKVLTLSFEVLNDIPEGDIAEISFETTSDASHYEEADTTYDIEIISGGVKAPIVEEKPPVESKPVESKPVESKPVEKEPVEDVTATDENPDTSDVSGIAVAAGLCAVMAAAFVITKKVND